MTDFRVTLRKAFPIPTVLVPPLSPELPPCGRAFTQAHCQQGDGWEKGPFSSAPAAVPGLLPRGCAVPRSLLGLGGQSHCCTRLGPPSPPLTLRVRGRDELGQHTEQSTHGEASERSWKQGRITKARTGALASSLSGHKLWRFHLWVFFPTGVTVGAEELITALAAEAQPPEHSIAATVSSLVQREKLCLHTPWKAL